MDYTASEIVTQKLLLYILKIPELQKFPSEIIQIFPLIVRDTIIINTPKFVVKSKDDIFTTTHPEEYIQQTNGLQLLKDNCTLSMTKGIVSHCNALKECNTFTSLHFHI